MDKMQKEWQDTVRISRLESLIYACQLDLAKYSYPNSGLTEKEVIDKIKDRLLGKDAMDALHPKFKR